MEAKPPAANDDLARVRNKAREQEAEIARLRAEAAEASGERARVEAETQKVHRREQALTMLVGRWRLKRELTSTSLRTCASGWPTSRSNSTTCAPSAMP